MKKIIPLIVFCLISNVLYPEFKSFKLLDFPFAACYYQGLSAVVSKNKEILGELNQGIFLDSFLVVPCNWNVVSFTMSEGVYVPWPGFGPHYYCLYKESSVEVKVIINKSRSPEFQKEITVKLPTYEPIILITTSKIDSPSLQDPSSPPTPFGPDCPYYDLYDSVEIKDLSYDALLKNALKKALQDYFGLY
ncbi:MAG: hypothetical protein A2007_02420 [Verrucomicrobia bacterium GWC2_42_7]|nr:MAG: hypothetical protein A2007_02420 [Verrucomicrobia bacterium GWC2_42_7]